MTSKKQPKASQVREEIVVSAAKRPLGRVASEVAVLLQGKRNPYYARHHLAASPRVRVTDLRLLRLGVRRLEERVYYRHSGHLGGLKAQTLQNRIDQEGIKKVFRGMVRGMLPRNRLRKQMLANLILEE